MIRTVFRRRIDRMLSVYDGGDWLLQRKARTLFTLNLIVILVLLVEITVSSLFLGRLAPEFFPNLLLISGFAYLMVPLYRGRYHTASSLGILVALCGISWVRYVSTGQFSPSVSYEFLQYVVDLIVVLFYTNLIASRRSIILATFLLTIALLAGYTALLTYHFHAAVTPEDRSVIFSGFLFLTLSGLIGLYIFLQNQRAIEFANEESLASKVSDRNYREIFNSTNESIFIHDAGTGQILDVNSAMLETYGFSGKEEALRHTVDDLSANIAPYTGAEASEHIRYALEHGPKVFEWLARRTNGEHFWVEVSLQRSEIGGHGRILAVVRNIAERKRVEQALKILATTFAGLSGRPFFEAIARHLATTFGMDYVYIGGLNPGGDRVEVLGGYAHGAAMGELSYDLQGTPCRIAVDTRLCVFPDRVQEQFPNDGLLRVMGIEGYIGAPIHDTVHRPIGILVALHSKPLHNTDPIIELFEIFLDRIAAEMQREKAEESVRESEQRFRNILQEVRTVAVQGFTADGTVLYWNKASERLFGYTQQEAIGRSIIEMTVPAEAHDAVTMMIRTMAESGKAAPAAEFTMMRKDGGRVPVFANFAMHHLPEKAPEIFCIDIDLTENKQAEEALRYAQKLESIGTLAGGIAHDFNNLLSSIMGQSSLALGKLPAGHAAANNITKALKASEHAADLTRQLLAYSGRGRFFTVDIDLNALVTDNIQMLEVSVPKTAELRYELCHPSPHLLGDVGQIQQILMNLIINAGEAMGGDPGTITVRTAMLELAGEQTEFMQFTNTMLSAGRYALLQVKDTGSGIDPESLKRIFDPFFTTKFTGRGLGLAAVLGIIRGHNGGLRITSEVGNGTTFDILLPLSEAAIVTPDDQPKAPVMVDGKQQTILVIDDDPFVYELLKDILEEASFTVLGVTDPVEGLHLFRQRHAEIAMVVLDYSMPGMDGKTAFHELLRIDRTVKVLLCSGYTAEETLSAFETDRPAGFFQKPYTPDDLLNKIAEIIGTT